MNEKKYSAMPHEKEVLLEDGAVFLIEDVIEDYQVTDKNQQKHSIIKICLKHDTEDEDFEEYNKKVDE